MLHNLTKLRPVLLLLLVPVLLTTACFPSHPQSTFEAAGPVAEAQLKLFYIIFWAAVFVFVVVNGAFIYAFIKYRRRANEAHLPKQTHGHTVLEITWTIAPMIILAIITVPTITTIFYTAEPPPGKTLELKVIAHQWWWEFEYPDLGITTANELHVPVGMAIDVSLESKDVIHSFWIPKLAGKMDLVPGHINTMWFQADRAGEFYGLCAEFCGTAHAQMRFMVHAEKQSDFDAWVESIKATPGEMTGLAAKGKDLFVNKGFDGTLRGEKVTAQRCAFCHTVEGLPIRGAVGPVLTHVGGRETIGAGIIDNSAGNLKAWLTNPDKMKPGVGMPTLSIADDELDALVAYLEGLQ
ncbi:MAG: cytochrome c oxidase subunit 2 [Chloroflexi bacterium]|jgi:cytochrome c oxidase subunit 2|nr:MAG: cytochrome c oxidase subunit 2 [Chloroflexota bacterium]